jgi:thiaminase/transcriptional activator TenA
VRGFVTFAGGVLASAPDKHIEVLLNGIGALTDELNWFRAKAAERGLKTENTGMCGGVRG